MSKLVPKLRFKEFSGEWDKKQINKILTIGSGKDYKHLSDGDIPVYGTGGYMLSVNDYLYDGESVCIGRKGTIDKPAFLTGKFWTVDTLFYTHSFQENIPKFIYLLFQKINWYKYNEASGVPSLSKVTIGKINIFIPKPEEQQKIASCLSSLDSLIEAQNKKVGALKKHKKGLMQQLFPKEGETVPTLRFDGFSREWEEKEVGELFQVTRGEVLSMLLTNKSFSQNTPYPVYSSQTKNNGLAGYYSEYLFDDAITWTTDGANAGDVNYRKGKFYCTNVCGVLINKDGYANQFMAELLNTVTRKHVSYVGNPKLMNGVMAKISIPIPTLSEQQRIASCLSSLDSLIEAQDKKIEALKKHKKGLMQQMFVSEGK